MKFGTLKGDSAMQKACRQVVVLAGMLNTGILSSLCNFLCAHLFSWACLLQTPAVTWWLPRGGWAGLHDMVLETVPFSSSTSLFLWLPSFWNGCCFFMPLYIHEIDLFVLSLDV